MYSLFYKEKNDFELYDIDSTHIPPHLHKNIEFTYVLEGTLVCGIGTKLYNMEKGDIAVIFPEQIHHYQHYGTEPGRVQYLLGLPSMTGPYMQTITTLVPENPIIKAKDVHPDIYYALETLELHDGSDQDDILHQAYLMIILARVLPLLTLEELHTNDSDDLVSRTVSYIAEHYAEENLTLTKMAHDLFVSPFALSRVFSGTFHTNFNKYLNNTRLEYVRYLLEYTDQSITEAYENAGFGSQRTFNRAFREHFRMTPKQFVDETRRAKAMIETAAGREITGYRASCFTMERDKLEVLRELRQSGCRTPVLLLTAKSEVADRIEGLDAGADDYLPKPFAMGELLARVRAMLRRREEFTPNLIRCGYLQLNQQNAELSCGGNSVVLPKLEYKLMELLMLNQGICLSTEDMLVKVWGYETESDIGVVWVYLSYLRKRLSALGSTVEIKARRGVGYTLEAGK